MSKSKSPTGGIGFLGLLAIVFITLKLVGKIDWSWLWVLAPLWIPIAVFAAVFVVVGVVWFLAAMFNS